MNPHLLQHIFTSWPGFASVATSLKRCLYQQKEPAGMNLQAGGCVGTSTLLQPLQPGAHWEEGSSGRALLRAKSKIGVGLT